jgi:O-methyltransferase
MTQILSLMAYAGTTYHRPPLTDPEHRRSFKEAVGTIMRTFGMNVPGYPGLAGDDMMVWSRHCGFTRDPDFVKAFEPYANSKMLRNRLWRIYTLCWAAKSCRAIEGKFIDIGCYDGRVTDIMRRYAGGEWELYDYFDAHPADFSKPGHGPELYGDVSKLFEGHKVVKGILPDSLDLPEKIAFAQIDLNHAKTELAVLEQVWPRLSVGGMIVLDDYGFADYLDSYEGERKFFSERGETVFECPTGQGIVIKRGESSGKKEG